MTPVLSTVPAPLWACVVERGSERIALGFARYARARRFAAQHGAYVVEMASVADVRTLVMHEAYDDLDAIAVANRLRGKEAA